MNRSKILHLSLLLCAFLLVTFSRVRHTGSDPRASLLVSESILTHGTIKLDHYGADVLARYGRAVREKNGHFYEYFPLGTPLVSLPFVALARGWGLSMTGSGAAVQMMIASVTALLTLFLLLKTAGLFLPPLSAGLISGVFWFGSSLAGTCGTALWSHNFATLFALTAIYSALKGAAEQGRYHWLSIGICLFFAYLCRPNMALLAPAVLLFYFSYHRRDAIKAGLLLSALLACFAGFSFYELGQILPDYYFPDQAAKAEIKRFLIENSYPTEIRGVVPRALFGNLFSPSRGILVFSPFILFAWLCRRSAAEKFKLNKSWLLIGVVWPLAHFLLISVYNVSVCEYPLWWAGWSFGARLMTDILPGLFLLTLRAWPVAVRGKFNRISVIILAASSLFAVYVHSYQGLFNPYSSRWNAEPNIDKNPEYLFDWKYPQFLHNRERHRARLMAHTAKTLGPLDRGEVYAHTSSRVLFLDWHGPEETHRWSEGVSSAILFILNPETLPEFTGELLLRAGTLGGQHLTVYLNDTKIYSGQHNLWNLELRIPFTPALLNAGRNILRIELPDARAPGTGDPRILALALKSFSIQ